MHLARWTRAPFTSLLLSTTSTPLLATVIMRTTFSFSLLLALLGTVSAQFNIFEQMFGGGGGGQQQHHQQQQNVPSDSSYYRSLVDRGTLLFRVDRPFYLWANEQLTGLEPQHTAQTTSAQTPSPAFTSHTTAPVPGQPMKTRSSWQMAHVSVCPRGDTRVARRLGRLSWQGRGCSKRTG